MSVWFTYSRVTATEAVNERWQPTQAELTRILGDGWEVEMQHGGECADHEDDRLMPCPGVIAHRPQQYRAVISSPVRIEAIGEPPVDAFDNLLRALA